MCSVHARALGEDADALLAGARKLGADTVIVPSVAGGAVRRRDSITALARELNGPPPGRRTRGCGSATTTTPSSLRSSAGGPALRCSRTRSTTAVLLEVDTYWAAVGGQDVPALLGGSATGSATCT